MNAQLAMITFLGGGGGGGQIDNTLPGSPAYPSHGLPPGGATLPVYPFDPTRPDNSLPGSGGRPDNSLPPSSGRPDNSLPGSQPGVDNTLPGGGNYPSHQPIVPGAKFVVKWLACHGLILVPDNTLPPTPEPK